MGGSCLGVGGVAGDQASAMLPKAQVQQAGAEACLFGLWISRESESLYLLYKVRIHDPPSLYWKEYKLNDTLYGSTGDLAASP